MTPEQIATASAETERLAHNLDITNVDHVALWLDENLSDASPIWLACRIVEAHEAILAALKAQQPGDDVVERVATVLAPFVCRPVHNGDCDDIAAGQSHARYVARAAIAAMQENPDEG